MAAIKVTTNAVTEYGGCDMLVIRRNYFPCHLGSIAFPKDMSSTLNVRNLQIPWTI